MAVLLKCYADDMHGDTVFVQNRKHPPDTPDPQPGDRVFVWKVQGLRCDSTHARGFGLAERGSLVSQITNDERRSPSRFDISIDASSPHRRFDNDALDNIESNSRSQGELALAAKLKADRLTGITGLNDEEADYLDALYDPLAIDLGNVRRDRSVDETTRQRLMDARLGQGQFRRRVLARWQGRCVVTGCALEDVLRASHIKPWRCSNNDERLNPANGLLLTANLDVLFDKCLISFNMDGQMLVSDRIVASERELLGIPQNLRPDITLGEERDFLREHQSAYRGRNGL
jgi:hypothetical protein